MGAGAPPSELEEVPITGRRSLFGGGAIRSRAGAGSAAVVIAGGRARSHCWRAGPTVSAVMAGLGAHSPGKPVRPAPPVGCQHCCTARLVVGEKVHDQVCLFRKPALLGRPAGRCGRPAGPARGTCGRRFLRNAAPRPVDCRPSCGVPPALDGPRCPRAIRASRRPWRFPGRPRRSLRWRPPAPTRSAGAGAASECWRG